MDGVCSHEVKRHLLLGRKAMTNLDSILKSRDITLPTKVHLVKAVVFPVVMYGCESWTIKKAEVKLLSATLCNPMDCIPTRLLRPWNFPGKSCLATVAISFSRESSWPGNRIQVSCIAGRLFTLWGTRERKVNAEELILLDCGVGEDFWESLGLLGDQTSQS